MPELSQEEIRQYLFARIDIIVVQHDLLDGFRVALLDNDIVAAYNRNARFFGTVETALFNSIVVLLYSLFETRDDTVNLNKLIGSVEIIKGAEHTKAYRNRMSDLKPFFKKVAKLRSEAVGHLTNSRPLEDTHNRANLLHSDVQSLITGIKELFTTISNTEFGIDPSFRSDSNLASIAVLAKLKVAL